MLVSCALLQDDPLRRPDVRRVGSKYLGRSELSTFLFPFFEPARESFQFNIREAEGWDMGKAYRTLVLKYDLPRLPQEAGKIPALLRVQEEFRQWADGWAKGGGSLPPPERPLKYFAKKFLHAAKTFDWLREIKKDGVEVKKMRPPLIFDAQLRLNNERDIGMGVFVNLPKREVRIRKWSGKKGNTVILPLGDKAVEWILGRVRENGKLVLVAIWIGRSRRSRAVKLYVALAFRREVVPIRPERLLVVDFNALHHGLAWAVVEGERVLKKGVLRPNISRILHLQKVAARLESICAEEDRACGEAAAIKSRIWRLIRTWEDDAVKELIWLARKRKAAIVVDVPDDESMRELKEGGYASERKAFLNFGRLRRRLRGLAEWYGVPLREERLYSTICPRCGRKMSVLPDRRVRCACGFEAHRDEVPALWAIKRFRELTTPSFSSSSAVLRVTALAVLG
jgi:putative transposase